MNNTWLKERIDFYLHEFKARGVQIALVHGDEEIVCARGVKNAKGNPLNTQTIFPIASTTKAFTAAAAAICVDRGLLNWDERVKKYLPWFELMDPYIGDHLTIRDAFCNRSGLPRHEFSWMGTPFNTQEVLQRLRYLPLRYEFRTEFRYTNQMYALMGEVVAAVSGMPFAEFMKQEIFLPLSMHRTCCSVSDIPGLNNFATPYLTSPEGMIDIPYLNIDNITGAGFINSNAEDIIQWLQLLLHKGKRDTQQIISEKSLLETTSPQIIVQSKFLNTPDFDFRCYGMGWFIESYRGVKLIRHTGGINGFFSHLAFIPAKNLGVMVMENTDSADICPALIFEVIDEMMGWERRDWVAYQKTTQSLMDKGMADLSRKILVAKNPDHLPLHALSEFAGDYEHPGYGKITIETKANQLILHFHIYHLPLELLNFNTFCFQFQGMTVPVSFKSDSKGNILRLEVNLEIELEQPILFERIQ